MEKNYLYLKESQVEKIRTFTGTAGNRKIFVLDTNVIMSDPDAMFNFQDNVVLIPEIVIEELDNHKKDSGDIGYNVRQAHRNFRDMQHCGSLTQGITTPQGGLIMIVPTETYELEQMPKGWQKEKPDNLILWTARNLKELMAGETGNSPHPVILVSNDINMHVKADAIGLRSEFYRHERVEEDYLTYNGRGTLTIPESVTGRNLKKDEVKPEAQGVTLRENMFLYLKDRGSDTTLLGKVKAGRIVPLEYRGVKPYGVEPRNASQIFAVESLMAPAEEIPLVILTGPAGTAKTFLTLACGLEQVMETNTYRRIIITRANVEFDKDIGALPGSEEEKVNPLLRGCLDNLELLVDEKGVKKGVTPEHEIADKVQYLFDTGCIKPEALGFLRGRSLTRQYVFIDEAQNTSISQMKGILTRAGEDTKIIISGDLDQIDNPRLDRHNCGLAYALKLMAGDPMCAVVGFDSSESTRSPLAARVAEKIRKEDESTGR